MRTVRRRRLKFSPKLATTMRPHGKWGDLLACLIPLSWCINILINSSFLLKLIEWQNESSLFTVKIRGKQWYWLYRIDFKNFTRIMTAPKNIGHNKWVLFTHGSAKQCDDYMSALQFRRQSNWMVKFWVEVAKDEELFNLDQPMNIAFYKTVVESLDKNKKEDYYYLNSCFITNLSPLKGYLSSYIKDKGYILRALNVNNNLISSQMTLYSIDNSKNPDSEEIQDLIEGMKTLSNRRVLDKHWPLANLENIFFEAKVYLRDSMSLLFSANPEETVRFYRKRNGVHDPVIIRPTYISDDTVSSIAEGTSDLLYLNLPISTSKLEAKPKLYENFLVRKQKRYKLRKSIPPKKVTLSRSLIRGFNTRLRQGSPEIEEVLKDINVKTLMNKDRKIVMSRDGSLPKKKYKMFKLNKKKTDINNLNVNRRMLRTRRTLVLPAHVNLTAVTNSFDVIHSWFIPGLGLKMDCIPGRSTHHTFFIDNVGFYYGQCAEVCGRYHHHMPIRICALPFDHFLLWWHHFGARRFLKPVVNKPGDKVDELKKETAWRTWAKKEYKRKTGVDMSRDPKVLRSRHLNAYGLRKYTW